MYGKGISRKDLSLLNALSSLPTKVYDERHFKFGFIDVEMFVEAWAFTPLRYDRKVRSWCTTHEKQNVGMSCSPTERKAHLVRIYKKSYNHTLKKGYFGNTWASWYAWSRPGVEVTEHPNSDVTLQLELRQHCSEAFISTHSYSTINSRNSIRLNDWMLDYLISKWFDI